MHLPVAASSVVAAFLPQSALSILRLHIACYLSLPGSSPLGACRQCPQTRCALQRSCSWAELSLCSAAHLPGAPSVPGARPSSAPEDQHKAALSLSPLGSPQVSLGLQGNLLGNRLKESLMFPFSARERGFFPAVYFLISGKKQGMRIAFPCPIVRQDTQTGQGGISFTPAEGRDSAESTEASPPVFSVLGPERDSAPSHAHHKPTDLSKEAGFLLPHFWCAQHGRLPVNSLSQL